MGVGVGAGAGPGVGLGIGAGVGVGHGLGVGVGVGDGAGGVMGVGLGAGVGAGVGLAVGVGVGVGAGVGVGVGAGVGLDVGVGVGVGAGVGVGVGVVMHGCAEMVFPCSVTAPLSARALPSVIVAPVFSVMLVKATMAPSKVEPVPNVAELPTCQKTLWKHIGSLITKTLEAEAVVSVLPISKTNMASGLFSALSVSVPVNCADDANLYTPGTRVRPPRSLPVRTLVGDKPASVL